MKNRLGTLRKNEKSTGTTNVRRRRRKMIRRRELAELAKIYIFGLVQVRAHYYKTFFE